MGRGRPSGPGYEGLRVRAARSADLDALTAMWEELVRFHADLGGPEYRLARGWKAQWQRFARGHIGRKDRLCLLAEIDARPTGFLLGTILLRPRLFEQRRYGRIYDVFVDPDHRNRGAGESLVVAAIEWFRARHVDHVRLNTDARNALGLRFWEKMEFETAVQILERRI